VHIGERLFDFAKQTFGADGAGVVGNEDALEDGSELLQLLCFRRLAPLVEAREGHDGAGRSAQMRGPPGWGTWSQREFRRLARLNACDGGVGGVVGVEAF